MRTVARYSGRWSSRLTGLLHALHAPVPAPAPSPPPVTYTCGQGSPPITAHHAHTHATHVCTHAPRPHGPLAPHSPSVTPPPPVCEHAHAHATTDACGWCGNSSGGGGGGECEAGGGEVSTSEDSKQQQQHTQSTNDDQGTQGSSQQQQQQEGEEGERGGGEGRGQGGLGRKLRRLLQKWSEGGQQQDTKGQDQDTVNQTQEPRPAPPLCSEPQTEGGAGVEAGRGGVEEGKSEGDRQVGEQIRELSCSSEHPGGDPGGGGHSSTQQHDTKPQRAPLTPPPLSWGVREVVRRARRDSGGSVVSEGGARGVRSVVNSTWSRWRRLQGSVGSLTANIRHRYHQHKHTRHDTKSEDPNWQGEPSVTTTPIPIPIFTPKQPQVVVVEAEPQPVLPPVPIVTGVAVGEGGRASPGSWSPVGEASPPSSSSDETGDSSTGTVIFRPRPVMVTPSSDDALRQHHHKQQQQTPVSEMDPSKASAGGGGEEGRRGSRRILRRTSDGPVWDGEPQAKRPSLASPPSSPPTSPIPPLPSRPPPTTTSYSSPNSPMSLTRKLFCETMMGEDADDTIFQPSSPSFYDPFTPTPSHKQDREAQEKGGGDNKKRGNEAEGWCEPDLGGVIRGGGGGGGDSSSLPSTTTCEDSHAPAAIPVGSESFGAPQALQDTSWSDEEAVSGSEGSYEGGVRRDSAQERRISDTTQVAALDTVSDVTSLISDTGADITPGGAYDYLPSTTFFVSEGEEEEEEESVSGVRLGVTETQTGMSDRTVDQIPIVSIIITDEADVSRDINELEEEMRLRETATDLVEEVCQEASEIVAEVRAEAHEIVDGVCTEASEIVAEVRAEASEIVAGVCLEATQQVAEVRAEASEIVAGVCVEASQKLTGACVPSVVVSTDEEEGTVVDVITIEQQTVLDITVEVETDESEDACKDEGEGSVHVNSACKQLSGGDKSACKQEKTDASACEQINVNVCLQEEAAVSVKTTELKQEPYVFKETDVGRTSEELSEPLVRTSTGESGVIDTELDTTTKTNEQDLHISKKTSTQESYESSVTKSNGERETLHYIDTKRSAEEEDIDEDEEDLITPTNKEWPGAGESEVAAATTTTMPPGSYATQREPLVAVVRQREGERVRETTTPSTVIGIGDGHLAGSPNISPESDDMTPVVNDVNFSLTYIAAAVESEESHAPYTEATSGMALADTTTTTTTTSHHHATPATAPVHDADFEEISCGGGVGGGGEEKELMTVGESVVNVGETSVGVSQGREAVEAMTTEQQQFTLQDSQPQQQTTTITSSHTPQQQQQQTTTTFSCQQQQQQSTSTVSSSQSQQQQQQQQQYDDIESWSWQLSRGVEEVGGVTSVAGEYDEGELVVAEGVDTPAVSQWEDGGKESVLRSDHVVPAGVSVCVEDEEESTDDVTRNVPHDDDDDVTTNVAHDVKSGSGEVLPRTVDDLGSTAVHSQTRLMQEIDDHLPPVTSQTGSEKQESNIKDQELSAATIIDHEAKIIELSVVKEEEGNGDLTYDKEELKGRLKTIDGDNELDKSLKIDDSKQSHVTSGYVDDKQETSTTSRTVPRERSASDGGSKESTESGRAVCGDGEGDQADIESDRALVLDDDDDEMKDVSGGERDGLAEGDDVEMMMEDHGARRKASYEQVDVGDDGAVGGVDSSLVPDKHESKYDDGVDEDYEDNSSSRRSRRRASSLKHVVESHPDVEEMFVDDDQLEYEEEIMEIEKTKTGPRILITIAGTEGSSSVGGVATSSVAGMGTGTTPTIMFDSASPTTSDMGGTGSLEGACFSSHQHQHHPHHHHHHQQPHHHHHHHQDVDGDEPCTHATSNNVFTTGTTTTTTSSSSLSSHLVTSHPRAPTPKSPITVDEWVAALPPNPTR
ncbi:hypothetical protein Pmani_013699 [Petrolisthes manimaculis]|uniref:Uncharacterized protein n=1 Tax=Petrolisthes manimaculis TaxID=1843537 RepID=A0AAE1U9D1_9EUCA|nr:hypothetical protein Pmani_013699 [Petrolisthes manimaculis]